ncbi:cystatin-B-like [Synchiropus splendidus]|uniref:cystatin-B-like n=1 Tax=Synchiropus splendidus TaxID=270530 RepID=UPI00237E5B18|nr:cystatin-B-like [Synchiropus splendidus]
MMMCGGVGDAKPADNKIQNMCKDLKEHAESKTGTNFAEFTAKSFRSQVVAGTNYFVKVHVGGDQYAHLRIHEALPCNGGGVKLSDAQHPKKEEDAIEFF